MAGSKDGGRRRDRENHYRCATILHPLRHRILVLTADGVEVDVGEISAELEEAPAKVAYHVRLLARRNALKVVPRCRPAQPRYRWSANAGWALKMLGEIDELGAEGWLEGGEFGDLCP
jgi:DNA-binding transcriptional ArsR family regulator